MIDQLAGRTEPPMVVEKPEPAMVFLNGSKSSFRCDCGANVFSRVGNIYTCNGCGGTYEGEPAGRTDEPDWEAAAKTHTAQMAGRTEREGS